MAPMFSVGSSHSLLVLTACRACTHLVHGLLGHALDAVQGVPAQNVFQFRETGLAHGGNIRILGQALGRGHGQGTQLAAFAELVKGRRQVDGPEVHMPAQNGVLAAASLWKGTLTAPSLPRPTACSSI